jgi:hypothetical protein
MILSLTILLTLSPLRARACKYYTRPQAAIVGLEKDRKRINSERSRSGNFCSAEKNVVFCVVCMRLALERDPRNRSFSVERAVDLCTL